MQVRDKLLIIFCSVVLSASFIPKFAFANTLDDAIKAYNSEDYKEALFLLKTEINNNPNDIEAYRWLGKTYEAMFEIDKSMEAYKIYEDLKNNKPTVLPSYNLSPTPRPTIALPDLPIFSSAKPTSRPTILPTLKPTPLIQPKVTPTPKPRPTPKPTPVPTPKPTLQPTSDGWISVIVDSVKKGKVFKIIPKNSVDLAEFEEKVGKNKEFILITCKVKYNKDIIIKTNSNEINLIDQNGKAYKIYAMSTFRFQYGGNNASKKVEALQVGDYFELSKKDFRENISFLFKIDSTSIPKSLKISGYKDLTLDNY